jgi:hypothetical protein
MREHGASHVRAETAWEFFRRLIGYRFGAELSEWHRRAIPKPAAMAR